VKEMANTSDAHKQQSTSRYTEDDTQTWTCQTKTIVRKYFHIFAIFVYLPGLVCDREMLCLGSTCALVVLILLESIRVFRIPPLGSILEENFKVFTDDQDSGNVILTHIYLLTGLTIPLWLYPLWQSSVLHPVWLSGVLSLGVGDTAAAVFGSMYGKHKWPGSKKSIEGTLAGMACQFVFVCVCTQCGIMTVDKWLDLTVAVVLTSILETFTLQIDNLVLPLFIFSLLV